VDDLTTTALPARHPDWFGSSGRGHGRFCLHLRPVDRATAELATALSIRYRLRAADATHLATAVGLGADRFITTSKRDFPQAITEISITYPADLPDG
jgi:hypothetical protein